MAKLSLMFEDKLVKEVPADQAFRPEKDGGCELVK